LKQNITGDITLRRMQNFKITDNADHMYNWSIESQGRITASGRVKADSQKLLTVKEVEVGLSSIRLTVMR
jgi:hypothetical protein